MAVKKMASSETGAQDEPLSPHNLVRLQSLEEQDEPW
jgi:hypothetical protein